MSESAGVVPRIDETDTEIELSAQELLALSAPGQDSKDEASPSLAASKPAKGASSRKQGLSLSLAAAVGIVGATYALTSPDSSKQSAAITSQPIVQSDPAVPQRFAAGGPVRFTNPFDTDEVFEFPPGTTETEARDAVAEVLLKRAQSRQKT